MGDHPLNLQATTLALNAWLLTGEDRFRDWMLEYVEAWLARTQANGGIIPSNVGPDGVIGSAAGGQAGTAAPMAGGSARWCRRPGCAKTATGCRARWWRS